MEALYRRNGMTPENMMKERENMKCIECRKNINVLDDKCPYCGVNQYDDTPIKESITVQVQNGKNKKQSIFSEEECFIYGIHPKDELYRKTMELSILSKDYRS